LSTPETIPLGGDGEPVAVLLLFPFFSPVILRKKYRQDDVTMETIKTKKYGLGWIITQIKGAKWYLLLFTGIIFFANGLEVSVAFFLKEFVDIATGESSRSILNTALLAGATVGIAGVLYMLSHVLQKYIYGRTERKLRTDLLGTIFTRRMSDISKQHTGELLTKLTLDTQAVSDICPVIIRNMVGGGTAALIAIVSMFLLDWRMALIILVLTPVLMFAMSLLTPFIEKASVRDKENDEENRSLMQENLSRIMLIKTYFMQTKTIANVRKTYSKKLRSGMKLGLWEGITLFSGLLLGTSMFLVTLGVGAYFVMQGQTTFGNLIAIVQLLNYIVNPIARLSETVSQVSQATASSKRIGELVELPADNEVNKSPLINANELVAKNMSFSYNSPADNGEVTDSEPDSSMTITGVDAVFPKGKITGLVGKSGSGKSTFLKLLIGLYEPHDGNISLNHNNGIHNGEEIMPHVAYVPPVDYLFSGTVLDNIVMSENEPRMDDVKKAAHDANILDFIESLPQGFDTVIGESGGTVSSGQAQRIAIARAIYKKSPVLVFDEPTANLDNDSIEKFKSTIKQQSKDKICIVVTHDESTMTVCDKVYTLSDGRLTG